MLLVLVLLFTGIPLLEIWLLSVLGGAIGWPKTILIALGTGVIGVSLARSQGLATLARLQQQMGKGEPPADALLDGAMILLAGAVLITPGVLTDAFGFALLIPPIRSLLKPLLLRSLRRGTRTQSTDGRTTVWTFGSIPTAPNEPAGRIVDAEVLEVRTSDSESEPR